MKGTIVYDSVFGNTEKIARAIAAGMAGLAEVVVSSVQEVEPAQLDGMDFLVVGSPTRAFRATPAIMRLLRSLPAGALSRIRVAAFDTRIDVTTIRNRLFRYIVGHAGYAAGRIERQLRRAGGVYTTTPEGFIVMGSEGPLKKGEEERAVGWSRTIIGGI